jgi:Pup amidohydrolase
VRERPRAMMDRLVGLETEYAIRFAPEAGARRPTNARVFEAYAAAVQSLVDTRPGMRERELFLANGGAIHYECQPIAVDDGLVEGATPECRSPSDVLLYQRAQDALLTEATPLAEDALTRAGYPGELGLLKNCRDAEGHWYGAQENYELEVASGALLWVWRAGLAALLPLTVAGTVATWALGCALIAILVSAALAVGLVSLPLGAVRRAAMLQRLGELGHRFIVVFAVWAERAVWEPIVFGFLLLYRAVAFRRARRALLGFLVTRQVFTGAGTLDRDRLALSEKALAARRPCRIAMGTTLAIFDPGNLCKRLMSLEVLRPSRYLALFRRRQRFQLGLSDSNMAQGAEYLRVATTSLVLDLAEAGALDDLPALADPVRTLHRVARDPDLGYAIAVQREYLARAQRFVRDHPSPSLEAGDVLARWREVLDALDRDPESLFGTVDWVTKRHLIERAGAGPAERKKIDLKYHELGAGYFARLERAGFTPVLVTAAEALAARRRPPSDSPARARARVMRELADAAARVRMSWDHVRVGGRLKGRVIRLDDHR